MCVWRGGWWSLLASQGEKGCAGAQTYRWRTRVYTGCGPASERVCLPACLHGNNHVSVPRVLLPQRTPCNRPQRLTKKTHTLPTPPAPRLPTHARTHTHARSLVCCHAAGRGLRRAAGSCGRRCAVPRAARRHAPRPGRAGRQRATPGAKASTRCRRRERRSRAATRR